MKKWKKWLTMLLSSVMVGSFAVACNSGDNSSESSGGGSSSSSSSGGGNSSSIGGGSSSDDGNSSSSGGGSNSQAAQGYVAAIEAMLQETKSLKIAMDVDMTEKSTLVNDDGTLNTDEVDVDGAKVKVEVTLSLDANNALSLYGVAEMEEVYGDKTYIEISEGLIIGGASYNRYYGYEKGAAASEIDKGYWEKEMLPFEELSVEAVVAAMMGDGGMDIVEDLLSAKEFADVKVFVKEGFTKVFEALLDAELIEDGEMSASIDFAPIVTDWVEYLNGIDETEVTFSEFVENTTEKLGIAITYDSLLDDISAFGEKTVADAFDNLDTFAEENFDMSLQEMYNAALESEIAGKLFVLAGMDADAIAQLKAYELASLKDAYGTIKFKELVNMVMAESMGGQQGGSDMAQPMSDSEEPEEVDYWAQIIAMLTQAKTMTLAETLGELPEIPLTANKLAFEGGITFDANKKITAIDFAYQIDAAAEVTDEEKVWEDEQEYPTIVEKTYFMELVMNCSMTVSSFSNTAVSFTAPTIDEIEMYLSEETNLYGYSMEVSPDGIEYANYYAYNPLNDGAYMFSFGFTLQEGETFAYDKAVTVVATWFNDYTGDYQAMRDYVYEGLYTFEITVSSDGEVEFGAFPSLDVINAWYAEQHPEYGDQDK